MASHVGLGCPDPDCLVDADGGEFLAIAAPRNMSERMGSGDLDFTGLECGKRW